MSDSCILATNSPGLSVGETAETTVGLVMDLLTSLGKRPVLVRKDVSGCVLNRLQAAVFRALISLLESGVMSVTDLEETARYGFGLRLPIMKVFELADLMGLDTIQAVFAYLFPTLDSSDSCPRLICDMVQRGELGVKSGRGFHDYSQAGVLESMQKKQAAIGRMVSMMTRFD